jgi:CDP-4-dehydro-6-deoxyglucose reductase, E3
MPKLQYKDRALALQPHESVLDCLLRHGEAIPYACKAGMCQACLVRVVDCEASQESRKWIKPALQAKGYTLACQWVPEGNAGAALPAVEEFAVTARLTELQPLNTQVLRVRLQPVEPGSLFTYRPGQYLTLVNPQGLARSYSIANDFERDGYIELHVAATAHGLLTGWLFREARPGMLVHLRGPAGECCYARTEGDRDQALLLAGTGAGLAPLYGIVHDGLRQGHTGPIHLLHGGRTQQSLYYVDELRALARAHSNFFYSPCAIDNGGAADITCGKLEPQVEAALDPSTAARTRAFLCGAPAFVHGMRKRLFLKGVRPGNIHCDPFTEREVAST